MNVFAWPVRVYYEDTDLAGVVYHANYLRFMERARTEWLRSLGIDQSHFKDEYGLVFAVSAADMEFLLPARFDDALAVETRITRVGHVSIVFVQEIWCIGSDGRMLLTRGRVKVACLDSDTFKPAAMPHPLLEVIRSVC
ncbi:tol-pal system-associated acyl-CoA thioesterase [Acidihalobacter ferrooxydans]|uniref:Tol-pal system-associated acyl-CoA thioesterase n=1 Tax=Acidihalobacter ferrooxydans TaxID=1765967 RepID=A0A1P8UHS5_9GAMM|nr:tol-pal system-associated acyl-CoA thioesterase [Acidihalobacter ferrooxydans]APZ43380.1 tol-pal system-associated acyl-CoA thioesterase [Acidihalobacter ferrooxydans]